MGTSISDGYTAIAPLALSAWNTSQDTQHVFHNVIGRAYPDVTLRPMTYCKGQFTAYFETETDADAARLMLQQPLTLTIQDDDFFTLAMSFVVSGSVNVTPESSSGLWTVAVDFQEIYTPPVEVTA